jgi:hypothetical protein
MGNSVVKLIEHYHIGVIYVISFILILIVLRKLDLNLFFKSLFLSASSLARARKDDEKVQDDSSTKPAFKNDKEALEFKKNMAGQFIIES